MVLNKKLFTSILLLLISFVCTAQLPPSPAGRPPGPPGDELPIDNGIVILVIAAVIYGAYKVYIHRKKTI